MSNLYLVHHGILGQKWGVRRYQNKDGSLTQAGRKRYGTSSIKSENDAEQYRKMIQKKGGKVLIPESKKDPRVLSEDPTRNRQKPVTADEIAVKVKKYVDAYYENSDKIDALEEKAWKIKENLNKTKISDPRWKELSAEYEKTIKEANELHDQWDENVIKYYKDTGKNAIERIINNIKYDPDRKK